jgi:hypothetical protein
MPEGAVSVSHKAQGIDAEIIHDSHTETYKGDRLVVK